CDVKLIKPDRRIYECITQKYNLIPNECVFIDDIERNIEAARDFGFNAVRFVTLEQAQRDLNAILGKN
ncbi:MAG: HAD-IA family hydrolase, partial [Synergistaceae bacterium]|nr:HAD-IA family hydrolase [Synergistaceae bacterium]